MKALVIGGTGPTGPHIINGLLDRGYAVTMLNRGSRDSAVIPQEVERLIGDPHFPDTLATVLGDRHFDLVVATYGRIRHVADVMATRTDRLVTVGGPPSYRGYSNPETLSPPGMPVPTPEDAPRIATREESAFGFLVKVTEDVLMQHHADGAMNVTHFRYPTVYGPWQVRPTTIWWIVQRCLDGRTALALPDGGLTLFTRGYSENMAHAVLLAVDQPEASAGEIYNCGDDRQFSLAQWVQMVAQMAQAEADGATVESADLEPSSDIEIVSVPDQVASTSRDLMQFRGPSYHQYLDLEKARRQLGYQDKVDVLDAVRRTVRWFVENPPADEQFISELRSHYPVEDRLIAIAREAAKAMADLPHISPEVHHAYAHPKTPNQARDHRNR